MPLKEIHALFAGKGTERQVLDAIKAGDPGPAALARNQFYGHLYLGLYFEAQSKAKKSTDYIAKAAEGIRGSRLHGSGRASPPRVAPAKSQK